jgi:hypothetical protein
MEINPMAARATGKSSGVRHGRYIDHCSGGNGVRNFMKDVK